MLSGCTGGDDEESQNPEAEAQKISYQLDLPKTWKTLPEDQYPQSLIFAAKESNGPARISPVLAVAREYLRPASLDDFVTRNLEEVRRSSQDFKMVNSENISVNSEQRKIVEYSETRSRDGTEIGIYSLYVVPDKYQLSYVVTVVFDQSETENRKKELKDLLLSFRIE